MCVVGISVSEDNSVCAKELSVCIHLFEEHRLLWLCSPILSDILDYKLSVVSLY